MEALIRVLNRMRAVGDHREVSVGAVNLPDPSALFRSGYWRSIRVYPRSNTKGEGKMNKLLSVIVAAMFAVVSASAFAASHAGAQMKDEKKTEKKAKSDKKAADKKAAPKKEGGEMKKSDKKAAPKKDAKKDEMKK